MWYKTKKEILLALGKDGRNTKYVDRMIKKGVIIEENGMYATKNDIKLQKVNHLKEIAKTTSEENKYLRSVLKDIVNIILEWGEKWYLGKDLDMEQLKRCVENELWKHKDIENNPIWTAEKKKRQAEIKWVSTNLYDHETRIGTATDRKGENNL